MATSMAVRFLPPASFHHPNKLCISVQWRTQPSKTKFSYFLKPSSRAKGKKFICIAAPQNQNDDNKVQNHTDMDIRRLLNSSRTVQWYPGHIAKAEKELKQQLKLMDVIIEVRDARIPLSTGHPEMDSWIGDKKKILVLNRIDMISTAEKNAWSSYFKQKGLTVILANGKLGTGTMKLGRAAKSVAKSVNDRRRAKGLLPRAVRAGVVGYPNVGKSSLINRLLKRRICEAASRPGVTRELQWVRIGKELDLLDSPGILPMQLSDQVSAIKLAICDDIGEKSYSVTTIAAILIEILKNFPSAGTKILTNCYKIDADGCTGEVYLKTIGLHLFKGDTNQAACRVLQDFRKGKFGWIALERPPPRRKALHW